MLNVDVLSGSPTSEVNASGQLNRPKNWWLDFGLFCLAVVVPSMAIFRKVGVVPMFGYVIATILALYVLLRFILPAATRFLNTTICVGLVIAFFVAVIMLTYWVYPQILEHHGFKLLGIQFGVSDSNDAYMATWKAMLAGKYPYYETSFLGNPISPMPGALFIAFPFYLAGATFLQNVFWLIVFWFGLSKYLGDLRVASVIFLTMVVACPELTYCILQAGDYLTNSVYVLFPALLLLYFADKHSESKWTLGFAVLFGFALSSRANYFLLVPIVFFALLRIRNFSYALKHMIVSMCVFALVTLPFYLYDPAHFSPLTTTNKLNLHGRFPHAAECVFLMGCLIAAYLGFSLKKSFNIESVCARMFFVQEFAILSGFVLSFFAMGRVDLFYLHFTLLAMLFGVFASAPRLFRSALDLK